MQRWGRREGRKGREGGKGGEGRREEDKRGGGRGEEERERESDVRFFLIGTNLKLRCFPFFQDVLFHPYNLHVPFLLEFLSIANMTLSPLSLLHVCMHDLLLSLTFYT